MLTETYPPGNAVTVYYDPRSPKTSGKRGKAGSWSKPRKRTMFAGAASARSAAASRTNWLTRAAVVSASGVARLIKPPQQSIAASTLLLLHANKSVCRPPEQKPIAPILPVAPGSARR